VERGSRGIPRGGNHAVPTGRRVRWGTLSPGFSRGYFRVAPPGLGRQGRRSWYPRSPKARDLGHPAREPWSEGAVVFPEGGIMPSLQDGGVVGARFPRVSPRAIFASHLRGWGGRGQGSGIDKRRKGRRYPRSPKARDLGHPAGCEAPMVCPGASNRRCGPPAFSDRRGLRGMRNCSSGQPVRRSLCPVADQSYWSR